MSSTPSPPLPWFFPFLPTPHPQTNNDGVIALLVALHLCIAALITPCTPGWKLFRAGIVLPIAMYLYWYCAWSALKPNHEEHWGVAAGCCFSIVRALELLVLYPAEENVYRVTPQADGDFVREPIPPPWTKAKLYWAYSLWWSNRGIGWNYSCTLPPSSTRHPFSRTSSRKAFLINRGRHYLLWIAFVDLVRAYMALGPGAAFFDGRAGVAPSYDSLTMTEKAVYSLCVCVRIMWSIEKTFTGGSLLLVAMGGVLGWEGEMWSPWGYPPLFGSIQELWLHPGLATVWSRVRPAERDHAFGPLLTRVDMAPALPPVAIRVRLAHHRGEDPRPPSLWPICAASPAPRHPKRGHHPDKRKHQLLLVEA
jgi:hypothetical protein